MSDRIWEEYVVMLRWSNHARKRWTRLQATERSRRFKEWASKPYTPTKPSEFDYYNWVGAYSPDMALFYHHRKPWKIANNRTAAMRWKV